MKKFLFLLTALIVSVCGAWAQSLASGVYEIQNVSSEGGNVGRGYLVDFTGYTAGPSIGACPWTTYRNNHPTDRNDGTTTCSYWYLYNADGTYYLFSLSTLGENTAPKFLKIGTQSAKNCTWQATKNAIEIVNNPNVTNSVGIRNAGAVATNEFLSMGCGSQSTAGCIMVDALTDGGCQLRFNAVEESQLTTEQAAIKEAGIALCATLTTYTVRIEGAPSAAQLTIGGNTYDDGAEFQANGVNLAGATATEIEGYDYTISLEDETTIVVTYAEKPKYPINFPVSATITNVSRRVNGLVLGDQTVNLAADNHVYRDLHETVVFEIKPGTTVKPGMVWSGAWMHGMVYVDVNNNGMFDMPEELVAHTTLDGNPGITADKFSSFTIPETPGDYRMRYKTDWVGAEGVDNGKDPGGRIGNDGTPTGSNSIIANSGNIIDVTLRVLAPEPLYTYTVTLTDAPEGAKITVAGVEYGNGETVPSDTELTKEDVTAEAEGYNTEVTVTEGAITVVYTVKTPEGPTSGTVTFDFDNNYATLFPTLPGVSSGTGKDYVADGEFTETTTSTGIEGVTVTVEHVDGATSQNRIWASSARLRLYGGHLTVTAPEGKVITKVVFDPNPKNFNLTTEQGTLDLYTWTGSENEVVFTCTKNTQIKNMTVSYEKASAPQPKTVDVTYTVKFGEQTLKTETITETVGQAPTFTLEVPAYVSVSGVPETVAEETTEVTVETALNEQAPFELGKEYIVFFRNGSNYYFWNNDNGTANEVRLNGNNAELTSKEQLAEKYDNYRWTVGGDWMNGFTFQNNEGLNIVAPAALSAGANFLTTTDEAARFDMVKQSNNFYRFYLHGQDTYYIAHTSHNSHRVTMWNDPTYGIVDGEGGASCVQFEEYVAPAPIEPVETKTVTLTFVTSTGAKYMLNNNEGTLQAVEYTAEAPESARFEATLWSNDKYTYKQGELYLGYHRLDTEFAPEYNYFTVASLEGAESTLITSAVPAGTVYLAVEKRSSSNSSAGVLIMKEADQTFAATSAPFFNGTYTSAMLVEEYVAPTPGEPINLEEVYLHSKSGQYFAIANGQVAVSDEPYAVTFTALEGQENAYSFRTHDNTYWINSGSNGFLSTAAINQTNNILNYYFYEATITETGVTGTLVSEPVKGKEYMVVVKSKKTDASKGLYAVYCGLAKAERFDVVKVTDNSSEIPATFTLTAENTHGTDATAGTLDDFQKVVWTLDEPESEPEGVTFEITDNEDGTFTVTPSDNEALYFYNVYSEALRAKWYEGAAVEDAIVTDVTQYISAPEAETHTGVSTINPAEWLSAFFGESTYAEGDYTIGVVAITQDGKSYSIAGTPVFHNYTYSEPKAEFPVEGKAYVIKNVEAGLFLNVIEHADKATILGTQPEKFFFTKKDGAWVIKNEAGLYVGGHAKDWNMSSSIEQLWNVVEVEGGYAFQRADATSKYIGFDDITVNPDDPTATAAYRDKNYATHHGVFSIFEYTFPLQGEAYKVKNVDAGLYMNISSAAEKNTTIEKTPEKIFFTVAAEGGFYIQDEEGNYVGAGSDDWTVANTPATWNVVEVEGGYAFQRTDATSKYLGLDSDAEHSAYFRDKGAANHYAHRIMLFDTPETTPLEDLAAAIEAAKAVKAEDYTTVPEDLFTDLANEIARAEALAQKGEDAAVSDINAEIAALEAAVKAITEYTEPTQEELAARLQAALTDAQAAVKANYNGENALAGLPGYKPAAVVEALEAVIAKYAAAEGELTRDMIVEVEHAIRTYNETEVCIPEVGKTYLIRNHNAGVGDTQGFSYVITAGEEGLELNSYTKVESVENKHLWTVSEKTFTVEDDWGDIIAEENRYVFTNVATGQMFGWTGSALGLIEAGTEPTMQTTWNYITKTPKEIFAGSKELTYGTLGLSFDNGQNHNRVAVVDMRTSDLSIGGSDLMMHGLWNTYSSAYIFEVYEPIEEPLSFQFTENGDGTYTITPSNNEDTYFACVTSDAINTAYDVADDATMFEFNCYYVINPETDAYKGATTINPIEWINEWFTGYVTPEPGEYRLLAAKIKLVQEEEDGQTYEWYEADGDIATYTFTIQDTVGLGTVLSAEAGKHIFNLNGVRQNTLQRGVNIVAGKKVMR